jgi:hypothetical protein
MLKRGDFVIANDCDAPEARMIAVLTSFDAVAGWWRARYLSKFPYRARCHADAPTPVADFGVLVEFRGDEFRCVQVRESKARYRDGAPRRWQDRSPGVWRELRSSATAQKIARAA